MFQTRIRRLRGEDVFCLITPSENDSKKERNLTGRSHPSGLKTNGAFGAREPRRSPATIHGEAEGSEVTSVLKALLRVGWWSSWSPACTVSTMALAPADGGSDEDGAHWRELH